MSIRSTILSIAMQEDLNFLLTNRIPRAAVTRFMDKFSRIRNPLVSVPSIAVMRFFTNPNLEEATTQHFDSLQECFTRGLKPGVRRVDADRATLVSPCDAIIGASGRVRDTEVIQAKGAPYSLHDMLQDPVLVERYRNGRYVTLRLTAGMYHRFHAPHDCTVHHVTYVSGDTFNTNPIALQRVEKLFCKNERAILRTTLNDGEHPIVLVAVASILVASIRLHFLDVLFHLRHQGPNEIPCRAMFTKGQEMGWFELGSTILVFAPDGFELCEGAYEGQRIQMGQPLLRLPNA